MGVLRGVYPHRLQQLLIACVLSCAWPQTSTLCLLLFYLLHPPVPAGDGAAAPHRPTVYFFFRADNTYARLQGGAGQLSMADITFFTAETAQQALQLAQAADVLLMDVAHGATVVPSVAHLKQYAAASPGTLQEKLVEVWQKANKLARRYFPASSLDECKAMRRLLCPTPVELHADAHSVDVKHRARGALALEVLASGRTAQDLTSRFEQLGGLPRQLFHKELAELDDKLEEALKETKLDDIIDKVNVQEGLTKLSKLSSMLLHYNVFVSPPLPDGQRQTVRDAVDAAIIAKHNKQVVPAWPAGVPTQLPFKLLPEAIRIPTKWLEERMYDFHSQRSSDDISSFISHAIRNEAVFEVRHQFFEHHANRILSQGGSFALQQLQDPRPPMPGAAPLGAGRLGLVHKFNLVVAGSKRGIANAGELAQLTANQYGQSTAPNEPAWDAAVEPNITLQHTTSETHSIVAGGMYDAELELSAKAGAAARLAGGAGPAMPKATDAAAARTAGFRLRHYFCVPPDRFAEFHLDAAHFTPTPLKPMPANVDFFVLSVRDPSKKRTVGAHMQSANQSIAASFMSWLLISRLIVCYVCAARGG
jgi:hypothetical protein